MQETVHQLNGRLDAPRGERLSPWRRLKDNASLHILVAVSVKRRENVDMWSASKLVLFYDIATTRVAIQSLANTVWNRFGCTELSSIGFAVSGIDAN